MADLALAEVEREAKACVACPLAATRTQVVFGVGDPAADLMFVGEGPGRHEDEQGVPFVGKAGQLLTRLIGEMGLTRDDVYIANVVKCRPPGNRDPLPLEIEACNPWLQAQLDLVQPLVVVPLGNFASKLLLATKEGITRTRGQEYPWRDAVVVPTFHPSAVLRGGGDMLARIRADMVVVERALRRRRAERDARAHRGARVKVVTRSPWQTRALAERIAVLLEPGDVVVLEGDLGAGKTAFVQGIAGALGIDEPVLSPTFVVVREYEAPLPLVHIDVYRLEEPAELAGLGLEELLDSDAVTLIEWGDRVRSLLSANRLEIVIELGDGPEDRWITVQGVGPRWHRRRHGLDRALAATGEEER